MNDRIPDSSLNRRRFLQVSGAAGATGAVALGGMQTLTLQPVHSQPSPAQAVEGAKTVVTKRARASTRCRSAPSSATRRWRASWRSASASLAST